MGVFRGLKLAWEHSFRRVMLEVDSKVVVDMLKRPKGVKGYNGVLVDRCIQLINREWIVEIAYIYRKANNAANWLAR